MVEVNIKTDIAQGLKQLEAVEPRQFPFIVAYAMNKNIKRSRDAIKEAISQVFDRPTPFTLNSLRIEIAKKDKLEAAVALKDQASTGVTPNQYLAAEVAGGPRKPKGFEVALRNLGILPDGYFAVPGEYARAQLDAFGNLPRSLLAKIIAYLRSTPEARGARSLVKTKKKSAPLAFFAVTAANNPRGLPLGIYQRFANQYRLVIVFVKQPIYKERLRFYEISQDMTDKYLVEDLRAAIELALSTSTGSVKLSDFTDALASFD